MPTTTPYQPEKESQQVDDIFASEQNREIPHTPEVHEQQPEVNREPTPEGRPEQHPSVEAETEAGRRMVPPPTQATPAPAVPIAKSPELAKIETILSEHLDELYLQMTAEQRLVFQQKGEEAATNIERLMQDVKLKIKEVLRAIREWLEFIPGINKFFLEQEAKIKTDRLLALHEQKHRQK
jgi:hypothetical protein